MKKPGWKALLAVLAWGPILALAAWCLGAILLAGGDPAGPGLVRWGLAALFVVGCAALARWPGRALGKALVLVVCTAVAGWWFRIEPSGERDWRSDQARLPWAEQGGTRITLHDLRDFRYGPDGESRAHWLEATYDTRDLVGLDFLQVHFSRWKAIGHTMVSFRFADGRVLCVSVEARKQAGERYSVLRGLFRNYELMYVFGTEQDLIGQRAVVLGQEVFLHPGRPRHEAQVAFLLALLRRAGELRARPTFYNTLTANCTTSLVRHWRDVYGEPLPLDWRWVLAGAADQFAYELGLIDTDLDFEATRDRDRIDRKARACPLDESFSACIRR